MWKVLIILIIEFELRGSGPPGCICTPIELLIFMTKQKSSSELLFTAKIHIAQGNYVFSSK